ncbi:MAG: DUF4430 domain-containing protein [Patescibacteria group bacterium]
MSKKYFYISLTIVIAIAMGSYILIRANKNIPPAELLSSTTVTTIATTTAANVAEQAQVPAQQQQVATSTATTAPETAPAPNITLSVAGSSYTAFAPSGSTVIDAMKILASTTGFSFSGKDYPSLGFFVDSINGKTAESGYSWILYVNGKLSGTGASQTTLSAGDTVEWRYEVNY